MRCFSSDFITASRKGKIKAFEMGMCPGLPFARLPTHLATGAHDLCRPIDNRLRRWYPQGVAAARAPPHATSDRFPPPAAAGVWCPHLRMETLRTQAMGRFGLSHVSSNYCCRDSLLQHVTCLCYVSPRQIRPGSVLSLLKNYLFVNFFFYIIDMDIHLYLYMYKL